MQAKMDVQFAPDSQIQQIRSRPDWSRLTRLTFRFSFLYLILYSLPFPLQHLPWIGSLISRNYTRFWQAIIPWIGNNILGIEREIPITFSGSGDKTYDWVLQFCLLALALIGTALWSSAASRHRNHRKLHRWLTLYMRFVLAGWMIIYGSMKTIPVQMPVPHLTRLVEPYGDFSPMGVLWYFMGSSPVYTSITGTIELLGGVLLIFPATALLGAIGSFIAMTQVFILNMCYDVPVKLFSFNFVLMSLFLIAPHWKRLINVLLLNRKAEPIESPSYFQRSKFNQGLLAFQILFGLYLVGTNLQGAYRAY